MNRSIAELLALKTVRRMLAAIGIVLLTGMPVLQGCRRIASRRTPVRRIVVLHSYAPDNARCLHMNRLLEKNLEELGVRAEITYHYLDTERKEFKQRTDSYLELLDGFSENRPDIVLINDDYAYKFYLECGHPLVGEIPAVFGGVYQPRWDLHAKFPNITGKWERLDYLANVRFMEEIFKKHVAVTVYYETTYMAKEVYREIHEQLGDRGDVRFNHYYLHHAYPDDPQFPADEELFSMLQRWGKKDAPYPYSVITFRPYRDIKGVAIIGQSGDIYTQEYYLNDLYGIITVPLGLSHVSPTFTTINEPFGFWNAYLGGYFTSCEQQTAEMAALAARILEGTPPDSIPVSESAKEYVVDWHALERFNLDRKAIPPTARFVNMPFYERNKPFVITAGVLTVLFVLAALSYMLFLYLREQKRTLEALANVRRKNTSLELAIQGGSTYVWKYLGDRFIFEQPVGDLPRELNVADFKKLIHPDDLPAFSVDEQLSAGAKNAIKQYRCRLTGPEYEWWEFRFSAPSAELTENRELSGLMINIQGVKDREEELIRAKALAEKAELKQSFLANMSHEIRTPLNAIVGFSNLLVSDIPLEEEDKKEFIETINRNCDLLLVLINDILELSRLDSGQMTFEMADCSVKKLVEDLYATHQLLVPKELKFLKEIPEATPSVYADAGRLTQVVTNFLTNACKFTKTGYIKLGYEAMESEVAIYVEDTGAGIPKEQQKAIFDRFYKQSEFVQGTGLGLAICQSIVEKLGGRIELRSQEGKGSRFSVVLACSYPDR